MGVRLLIVTILFTVIQVAAQPGEAEVVQRDGKSFYKHVVKEGETVWAIHRLYDVSASEILEENPDAANGLAIGDIVFVPKKGATGGSVSDNYKTHKVASGETLFGIARQYKVRQKDLLALNPYAKDGLKVGQELKIPKTGDVEGEGVAEVVVRTPPTVSTENDDTTHQSGGTHIIFKDSLVKHVVQKKETLYSLSKRYMVHTDKIREANDGLRSGLKAGDTINIPMQVRAKEILEKKIVKDDTNAVQVDQAFLLKDEYNIVLLAPLFLDKNQKMEEKRRSTEDREVYAPTKIGIDFYAGVKLALDSLSKAGISTNLVVYDTHNDTSYLKSLLTKEEFLNADLIIGPFYNRNVRIVAEFALEKKIHMVIPVPQGNKVLFKNPYVSKAITSTPTKIEAMMKYVAKRYPNANIILVDSKKENEKYFFEVAQESLTKELETNGSSRGFTTSFVQNYNANDLKAKISKSDTNVIVTCSKDISFATNFMTKVNGVKNSWDKYSAEIIVFALDDWEKFASIDPLYKEKLNYHYVSHGHIAYDSLNTKSFILNFRKKYGYDPDDMGYTGFDVAFNYVSGLAKYGTGLTYNLQQIQSQGLQLKFAPKQVQEGSGFENQSIFILRQIDYDIIPVEW